LVQHDIKITVSLACSKLVLLEKSAALHIVPSTYHNHLRMCSQSLSLTSWLQPPQPSLARCCMSTRGICSMLAIRFSQKPPLPPSSQHCVIDIPGSNWHILSMPSFDILIAADTIIASKIQHQHSQRLHYHRRWMLSKPDLPSLSPYCFIDVRTTIPSILDRYFLLISRPRSNNHRSHSAGSIDTRSDHSMLATRVFDMQTLFRSRCTVLATLAR
jgi:hypothetical protein